MFKHFFAITLLTAVTTSIYAQTTPPAPSQTCALTIGNSLGARQPVEMDYGQKSKLSPVNDPELQQEATAIAAMDSGVLAINYLIQHGWQIVAVGTLSNYEHLYFRRVKP